ncbi:MAG: hypothetical protein WBD40_07765, partial [Tepidisphaeraceae bacterium]
MPDLPAVMLGPPLITFDSPPLLAAGLATAAGAFAVAVFRRPSLSVSSRTLIAIALLALALAAGGPRVPRELRPRIAVMIDGSASTRGAAYHDERILRADVVELLGDRPYSIVRLDHDADRTRWTPPPPLTTAVLLFSDGRFDPPRTAPPVYPVIDPALDRPTDAAVTSLEGRGQRLIVTTSNSGPARELSVDGKRITAEPGHRTATLAADGASTTTTTATALLAPGDAWPENDALSLVVPPPAQAQRWWVGGGTPSADWRIIAPSELPTDAASYLAPSLIVLNNIPADAIMPVQGERLQQYIRDLGGGVL